jgi:hypothetical protein
MKEYGKASSSYHKVVAYSRVSWSSSALVQAALSAGQKPFVFCVSSTNRIQRSVLLTPETEQKIDSTLMRVMNYLGELRNNDTRTYG